MLRVQRREPEEKLRRVHTSSGLALCETLQEQLKNTPGKRCLYKTLRSGRAGKPRPRGNAPTPLTMLYCYMYDVVDVSLLGGLFRYTEELRNKSLS